MKNKLENSQISENKEISKIFDKNFSAIVGYIFVYDKNGYNETIFKDFLGMNLENYENAEIFLKEAEEKLNQKIQEFKNLEEKIKNDEINLENKKSYFLSILKQNIDFLDYLKGIIKIETQKIKKFDFKLDEKELEEILENSEEKEKKFFGEKISENPKYSLEIIESLEKVFQKNKNNLEEDEIIFLENILEKLREKTNTIGLKYEDFEIKNSAGLKDNLEKIDKSILNKKVKREDYKEIFQLVFEILGLDLKVILDEKAGSMKLTTDGIHIPTSENYKELEIKKILDLISHEIETHAVTQENNEKIVGKIKPIGYQFKEEGTAMIFGDLASGGNINKTKISNPDYMNLVGEVFSGEDLKKFTKILAKLKNTKIDFESRFLRVKRGKDFEKPGINPKEKAYFLGKRKIIEKINSGENILNLFIGKNSFETEEELTKILGTNKKFSLEKFRKKGIILPLMIGEVLKYKLLTKTEENKGLLGGFLKYFNDKYGPIFNNLGINYKDFVKNYIGIEIKRNKEKIKKILEILIEK